MFIGTTMWNMSHKYTQNNKNNKKAPENEEQNL